MIRARVCRKTKNRESDTPAQPEVTYATHPKSSIRPTRFVKNRVLIYDHPAEWFIREMENNDLVNPATPTCSVECVHIPIIIFVRYRRNRMFKSEHVIDDPNVSRENRMKISYT